MRIKPLALLIAALVVGEAKGFTKPSGSSHRTAVRIGSQTSQERSPLGVYSSRSWQVLLTRGDSTVRCCAPLRASKQPTPPPDCYYSDDLFGLIFLTGVFILQDVVFASVFLVLSAIAAVLTNVVKRLPPGPVVPGYVGACTLLVSTGVRSFVGGGVPPPELPQSMTIEQVLCCFSFVYGLFPRSQESSS